MALNKTIAVDRIEVLEMGQIQVRTATVIDEDGTQISRTFHRHVLNPGADLTDQTERVTGIANATWTAEVLSNWEAFLASLEA
jgi:hypothetical protein